jgi:transposase
MNTLNTPNPLDGTTTLYLGIDIAKEDFSTALLARDSILARGAFRNTPAGFRRLLKWSAKSAKPLGPSRLHVCMEATGTYGMSLAFFLHEQFLESEDQVSVVNPQLTRSYGQSRLLRTKTDKVDAENIAHFCATHHPAPWQPPSPAQLEIKELTRRCEDLKHTVTQEKNRLGSGVTTPKVRKQIQKHIRFLEEQIRELEAEIKQLLDASQEFADDYALLVTIPGIGFKTAARILAEVPNIRRFEHVGQLVAYAGLNPSAFQSGTSVHRKGRLSKKGNPSLRNALYMPTLAAMTRNPIIKAYTDRLKANGKPKMVAVGAGMRKLLHIIFGVLKSGKPFDPHFVPVGA